MATDRYEWDVADIGTTGWNAIYKALTESLDTLLMTYLKFTLGEDVSEGDALYIQNDGKWYKALADDTHRPAQYLAVEDGVVDTEIRGQRVGPFTLATWTWVIGKGVWLSAGTWGGLTQTKPSTHAQFIGIAIDTDTINLNIHVGEVDLLPASTTTTTTTTSSSTTTTTSP